MVSPDLDPSVSSAISASSPPLQSTDAQSLRDDSYLAAPLISCSPPPGESRLSATGSPGPQHPPRHQTTTPNPPPLPSLPIYRGAWESLTSSPENRRTESSVYYTTAWGSPYAAPSPRRLSWSLSQYAGVGRSRDSSPSSMLGGFHNESEANNTDFLKPSAAHNSSRQLNSGDSLGRKGGKSIRDFTQDWINQYLTGQPRTEKSNWLSDDSGSEAPSFITALNHFADDPSDDWLGLEDNPRDEDLLKTPTLADFVGRRTVAGIGEGGLGRQRNKGHLHRRTDTLRQEDFWGFAYDKDPQSISMAEPKDNQPGPDIEAPKAVSPTEKPLPPPPTEPENGPSSTLKPPEANPKNGSPPLQRPRKKIVWKGKACIIALPLEDKRGSDESGYRLLSAADVEQRLQRWAEEGYDVRGFSICAPEDPSAAGELGSLSRPTFPDPVESQEEWSAGNYAISFPDKAEWDAYVNYLQEEKLRALGVSLGDDDMQPSVSPASAAMSQVAPQFPGLIASPPIPTASGASNPFIAGHPFSPHFNQSANHSTGIGSLTSPASQFSIQTPFMGSDQNVLPGFPMQFQPTPPAQGSLTPQSFFNVRQPGVASTVPGTLPNLTSYLSPVSPLNVENGAFHPGLEDTSVPSKDSFGDQSGHDFHGEPSEHQRLYRAQTPEVPDNFHASNVEIAQPTPRGHGHNLSETLQKGLDHYAQTHYHLEESIERQLDEDEPSHNVPGTELYKSRWAMAEDDLHLVHGTSQQQHAQPLPHQNNHLYGQHAPEDAGHEGSDFDTNPSLSGTPQVHQTHPNRAPWHESKPSTGSFVGGHRSKLSTSTLNVAAKEFDPTASFSSQNLPFQNNFQFLGMGSSPFAFGAGQGFKPSALAGSFNIAAPAFSPAGISNQPNAFSGGFKFSSASFNVDAPAFNPSGSFDSATAPEGPASSKTKIFDVDLSELSRSSNKKSKAIPIVRPDEVDTDNNDKDTRAGNDNDRPVPTDRHKRARRGDEHDEGEAQFSSSGHAHALTEAGNNQVSQVASTSHVPAEGKENAAPDGSQDGQPIDVKLTTISDEKPAERKASSVSEATTWVPHEFKNEEEMAAFNAASPDPPGGHLVKRSSLDQVLTQEDEPSEDTEETTQPPSEPSKTAPKSSILSPTAKPFEFKPAVPAFVPLAANPPSQQAPNKANATDDKKGGLMASRYAVPSPPPQEEDEKEKLPSEHSEPETQIVDHALQGAAPQSEQTFDEGTEQQDSPDEDELNAIMEQLNDGSDVGIERSSTPPAEQITESIEEPSAEPQLVPAKARSDAPSPSPSRNQNSQILHVPKLASDLESQSHTALSQRGIASGIRSPVRQLISLNEHISDWDDVISSGEDEKLANRSRFFDRRVNDLVGSAVEERLFPLERALGSIQQSVISLIENTASQRALGSASAEVENSDADDEDDSEEEHASYRTRSPLNKRDRKLDKLKNVFLEALASHEFPQPPAEIYPFAELAELRDSFAEFKAFTIEKLAQDTTSDLKVMIQEVISHQRSPPKSDAEEIGAESLMLQIDGLKSMLRLADERAEQEFKLRREAQESVAELQNLLRAAEEDAARHSDAAGAAEARLLEFKQEKIPYFEKVQFQSESLAEEHKTLQLTLAELSAKNIALEGTLDEYRVSSDHFRRELEKEKAENKELRTTIDHLKVRIEDSMNARRNLHEKFDRLQEDMATATHDIARDTAAWRKREEDQIAKYNGLRAAYDREVKLREKLESDINELEQQEREAAKLKFIFGQSQQENARLEELVANLRLENHDLQVKAARFEREFNEARESSRVEIQRTRTSLEADVEAANSQVNIVRAELEAQIIRLQSQIENVRMDADTSRERYEMLLEEANEAKAHAVAAAAESKEMAIDEQRKLHERVLNDLRERHARALHNSSEDRQRGEAHLLERLALSDDKVQHLQDRVGHLEEKLEIAQSAARAAAQAAQSAKAAPSTAPSHSTAPSMSYAKGSMVPEKISPQALRESILVLQDQLQQRETRIEELEQEISTVDKDAPNKLKEKDTEITWLRELLGVRVDDLQDIINMVSRPSFDQQAVRDAAIRLKANLQMQLQEKDRAQAGHGFPSLSSISTLAASPRALPLAAAAAWGSWRKGRENSNVSEQTPSKSSNAGAFLSGLLTPPSAQVRQTPPNGSAPSSRPLKSYNNTPRPLSRRQAEPSPEPPSTPPLLRKSSYDHDAEPAIFPAQNLFGDDIESTVDGMVSASPRESVDEPFGPQLS